MCSLNGSVPPEMKGYLHPAMMMMMAVGAGVVSRRPGFPAHRHLTGFKEHTVRALQTLWPSRLIDQRGCALSETEV